MKIVLATANAHKVKEIREILIGLPLEIHTLAEFLDFPETKEDAGTFEGNALKKAREVFQFAGMTSLADDSGLEVKALQGRPGVYSARYAGSPTNHENNIQKVLEELEGVSPPERQARFYCVLALVGRNTEGDYFEKTFEGYAEGVITEEKRGKGGFGYDPIFFVPEFSKTMAELEPEVKNRVSHRGRALEQFKLFIKSNEES